MNTMHAFIFENILDGFGFAVDAYLNDELILAVRVFERWQAIETVVDEKDERCFELDLDESELPLRFFDVQLNADLSIAGCIDSTTGDFFETLQSAVEHFRGKC